MGVLSAPITEIEARLQYHGRSTGILGGFRIEVNQTIMVGGQADLPAIRLNLPNTSEVRRGRNIVVPTLEISVTVSTDRNRGIACHLGAIEKVMDALETSITGQVDPGLNGTLRAPILMSSGSQNALELSLNSDLSLKLETQCSPFANRRSQ